MPLMGEERPRIQINEVFRDGIQAVPDYISLETKLDYLQRISQAVKPGSRCIVEVTAFVSPRAIPQHADAASVIRNLKHQEHIINSVLIPNKKGFDDAMEANGGRNIIGEFAGVTAASDTFLFHNLHTTPEASIAELGLLNAYARTVDIPFVAYVSCMAICPYEGVVTPEQLRVRVD